MEDKCNFAVCLALYHLQSKDTAGVYHGVLITPLDLWAPNKDHVLSDPYDQSPKVIDFFNKITEEEFHKLHSIFMHSVSLDFIGSSEGNSIPLYRILGVSETTSFLGLTTQAFVNWRNRYEDFPKPIVQLTATPLFDKLEVESWAMKYGKLP